MSQELHEAEARSTSDLFTPEEHRVLAKWFGVPPPPEAAGCRLGRALARLGVDRRVDPLYRRWAPAVARIVLEAVEDELPGWAMVEDDEVVLARTRFRPAWVRAWRREALVPEHLFTLNWADTAPGISWPAAYYVTWVPYYDRCVVTCSADSPDRFGYCDVALGHFGPDEALDLEKACRRIVTRDWRRQRIHYHQERWWYLFLDGRIDEEEANAWADAVWGRGTRR